MFPYSSKYQYLGHRAILQYLKENREKEFIEMGVNDFGGISPFTIDYINPEKKWPLIDELKSICKTQGYILKERLPIYDKYIQRKGFCSEKIKKTIDNIIY